MIFYELSIYEISSISCSIDREFLLPMKWVLSWVSTISSIF